MLPTVGLVGRAAIDNTLLAGWRELAERAIEPNPFFEPDFLLPSLDHLDADGNVRLLTVSEGTRTLALVPVLLVPRWKRLPIKALVTWRHDYCFLGTPLVDREKVEAAVDALTGFVRSGTAGLLELSWVAVDGPVMKAIRETAKPGIVTLETFERALLDHRDDGDYLDALGRETRHRLAQRRRALERELGGLHVKDHAAHAAAYERFLALEASGWKGVEGTSLASVPEHAAFFREVAAAFARSGRLELRSLEAANGTNLAMSVRIVAGDGVFCFKVAYDEQFRKYAPGLQLEIDTLCEFHAQQGMRWADSCTAPGNKFFESLFPQRRKLATIGLPRRVGPSAIMVRNLPRLRRLRWQLRRHR